MAFSASKTGLGFFAFKAGGSSAKQRGLDILERVHVDDGVCVVVDLAGHQRHDPTP
jgi:hypothetical protein